MQIMIPAQRSCPSGWTKEYEGYLMSTYAQENKATFECIDEKPEYVEGRCNSCCIILYDIVVVLYCFVQCCIKLDCNCDCCDTLYRVYHLHKTL